MSEAIDYRENGTIVVTLDKAYTLAVPMADQVLRWHEALLSRQDDVWAQLDALTAAVEQADEGTPEHREAARELNRFSRRPAFEFTVAWLEDVTSELADEFPPKGEWPGWLVNQAIPADFISHWKLVPKVSGLNGKT